MDEYISRNELLKDVNSNIAEADNERCAQILEAILNAPTADVVPKSEVESIITLNSQLEAKVFEERKEIERLKKYNTDVAFKHYNDGKAELASEIFAEIETLLALNILVGDVFTGKYFDADLENDIAELKKKYTEGEQ